MEINPCENTVLARKTAPTGLLALQDAKSRISRNTVQHGVSLVTFTALRTLTRLAEARHPLPKGRGLLRLERDGLCSPLPVLGEGSGVRGIERSETRSADERLACGTRFLMKSESMTLCSPSSSHDTMCAGNDQRNASRYSVQHGDSRDSYRTFAAQLTTRKTPSRRSRGGAI